MIINIFSIAKATPQSLMPVVLSILPFSCHKAKPLSLRIMPINQIAAYLSLFAIMSVSHHAYYLSEFKNFKKCSISSTVLFATFKLFNLFCSITTHMNHETENNADMIQSSMLPCYLVNVIYMYFMLIVELL